MSFISICFLLTFVQPTLSYVYVYNYSNKSIEKYDDRAASFGPQFPSVGLKGYITTTKPENGCAKISPPPKFPTGDYHWIALIPRTPGSDSCQFVQKVQNAQNANFSAVIIYNYNDDITTMGSDGKNTNIPSTLITHQSGLALISKYLYNKTTVNSTPIYHVEIFPGTSLPLAAYLVSLCIVLGVSLVVLILAILAKTYLGHRRTRRNGLPRSALRQLKTKKFVKGDPWEVCAICLDDYETGAKLRILPCDHAYHMKCIDPWLINNQRQCPVCKRYVFPNDENSNTEANAVHQAPIVHTEQTPLIDSDNDESTVEIPTNQQPISERRSLSRVRRGVRNASYASNESTENGENFSTSQQSASTNHPTTMGVSLDRPSSNSRRYGSMTETIITPRGANFFVGSISGATDNTNVSSRSVIEDVSDIEAANVDSDSEVRSAKPYPDRNLAYVNDEESTIKTNQTHV